MYSAPCLTGVFSICFFLFVTIWVTSLGSILRSCELRRNFSFTPCFRGPQMVRYASAFRLLPAQVHSSGRNHPPVAHSLSGSSFQDPKTGYTSGNFPYPAFELIRDNNPVFTTVFGFSDAGRLNLQIHGQADLGSGQYVTGAFFSSLGVPPA